MKRFYIWWDVGSCNDGDHDTGFTSFPTLVEVMNKAEELKVRYYDVSYTIVEGVLIEDHE